MANPMTREEQKIWINEEEKRLLVAGTKPNAARMLALQAFKKKFSPPTTPTKPKPPPKPTGIRTMGAIKAKPLPNAWVNSSNSEIQGITRDEYDHGTKGALLVMQGGSWYARSNPNEPLRFVCNMDDPDADAKTTAIIERDITHDMNGAPDPTRHGLQNEHFGPGASQGTLLELVHGTRPKYSNSPKDWHDWARCAIAILRKSKGNEAVQEELIAKAKRWNKCPYWDALLDKWMILVQKILYSNEIETEVFSRMFNLLEGFTTGNFMFLKNTMSAETVDFCNRGWNQINEIWGDDAQWPNQEGLATYRRLLNRN